MTKLPLQTSAKPIPHRLGQGRSGALALALCASSLLASPAAHAVSLAWDPGATPAGTAAAPTGSGGAGTWNLTNTNWSSGGADQAWVNGSDALFGGTAGAVTFGASLTANSLTFSTSGYTITGGANVLTLTSGNVVNNSGSSLTIATILTGANGLSKSGNGRVDLNAVNTYTGDTNITVGSLTGRAPNALPAATTVNISSGATLDMRGSQTVSGLTGSGTVNQTQTTGTTGTTLTVSSNTVNSTFAGILTQTADANHFLALTKAGSSTLILNGNNSYTGATTVNGGAFLLNGTNASAVTVSNTGTVLGGTGTIAGAVTVNGPARITGATAGTIGTLTLQSTATFTGTSGNLATYQVDIGSGTNNSDRLTIGGALDLSNAFDQLTFVGTPDGTSSYILASYASVSGTFNTVTVPAGYALQYNATELDLVPAAVPEPGTVGIIVVGLAALFCYHRRSSRVSVMGSLGV